MKKTNAAMARDEVRTAIAEWDNQNEIMLNELTDKIMQILERKKNSWLSKIKIDILAEQELANLKAKITVEGIAEIIVEFLSQEIGKNYRDMIVFLLTYKKARERMKNKLGIKVK